MLQPYVNNLQTFFKEASLYINPFIPSFEAFEEVFQLFIGILFQAILYGGAAVFCFLFLYLCVRNFAAFAEACAYMIGCVLLFKCNEFLFARKSTHPGPYIESFYIFSSAYSIQFGLTAIRKIALQYRTLSCGIASFGMYLLSLYMNQQKS
jgi:hypothetical protein